jgi:hypothetical protein
MPVYDYEEVSPEALEKAKVIVDGGFAAFDEAVDRLRDAWARDDDAAKKVWQQAFRGYANITSAAGVVNSDDHVASRCFQIAMYFEGGESPALWPDKATMYEVERDREAWHRHNFCSPS